MFFSFDGEMVQIWEVEGREDVRSAVVDRKLAVGGKGGWTDLKDRERLEILAIREREAACSLEKGSVDVW